jgi:leucyl aminopeptidase
MTIVKKAKASNKQTPLVIVGNKKTKWADFGLTKEEVSFVQKKIKTDEKNITLQSLGRLIFIVLDPGQDADFKNYEKYRNAGFAICAKLNSEKVETVYVNGNSKAGVLSVAEGIALSNYQFLKYFKDKAKRKNSLGQIHITSSDVTKTDVDQLNVLVDATSTARTLVNEPQSYLDAVQMAKTFVSMGKEAGVKVEVLTKAKIKSLKFGGLLAVNMGSQTPPTFTIMEYKPAKAVNKNPIVLVGKGVVYDTGGLSLKPTANSMDYMKSDMGGAAVAASAIYGAAKMKLPVHIISLIPATDNRPGELAYAPGDVIKMYNGMTVEVLNTDAEGRMILADALSYAKKFKPELVMDFATLTGAAAMAIGQYGIVCMGTAPEKTKSSLKTSGENAYERLVEMPFWDEYADLLKSEIADLKNIGGRIAGAITAGKFLENFTDYPWMHFDIAGPAYLHSTDNYRGKLGTGTGVRMVLDYLKNYAGK